MLQCLIPSPRETVASHGWFFWEKSCKKDRSNNEPQQQEQEETSHHIEEKNIESSLLEDGTEGDKKT